MISCIIWIVLLLSENCTPDQKIACFVLYLKIINTFFKKNDMCIWYKLSKELKKSIEI